MRNIRDVISAPAMRLMGYRPQRVSAAAWDREYQNGSWKYLEDIGSIAGQSSVLGYCQFLSPETILDVGCGAGLLASKLKILSHISYLGIDISPQAIAQAAHLRDARTDFRVWDADDFVSNQRFDVVIFNQCLNYLPDPATTVARYATMLEVEGKIVVSMFDCARTRLIWAMIERVLHLKDWMMYRQAEGAGQTKVFVAKH